MVHDVCSYYIGYVDGFAVMAHTVMFTISGVLFAMQCLLCSQRIFRTLVDCCYGNVCLCLKRMPSCYVDVFELMAFVCVCA